MTIEVRVPQLPESVADATLVAWRKQPGDAVTRDENMVDLETDKVVLEVPAPATGVVKELKVQNGTVVTSGQVLAVIEEGVAARPSPAVLAPSPGGPPTSPAKAGEVKTSSGVSPTSPPRRERWRSWRRRCVAWSRSTSWTRQPLRAPAATGASRRATC